MRGGGIELMIPSDNNDASFCDNHFDNNDASFCDKHDDNNDASFCDKHPPKHITNYGSKAIIDFGNFLFVGTSDECKILLNNYNTS